MNRTRLLLNLVAARHPHGPMPARQWIYAEEVRVNTGFGADRDLPMGHPVRIGWEQRIDAFAIHCWESRKYERVAYEVKISRTDLRRELVQSEKAAAAMALSNRFYLVLDHDVTYDDLEIPDEWGILQLRIPDPPLPYGSVQEDVDERSNLRTSVRAPWRNTEKPGFGFMLSLARRVHR